MTIGDVKKNIHTYTEQERARILSALDGMFTVLSKNSLRNFQKEWVGSQHTYKEFCVEQNRLFLQLIDIETSEVGKEVRKDMGLAPLTLETELPTVN